MTMIPICFRVDKRGAFKGNVTAVFLDTTLNPVRRPTKDRVCYAHVGQHSECSLEWILSNTRPATKTELQPLLNELRSIYDVDGDSLVVRLTFTRNGGIERTPRTVRLAARLQEAM